MLLCVGMAGHSSSYSFCLYPTWNRVFAIRFSTVGTAVSGMCTVFFLKLQYSSSSTDMRQGALLRLLDVRTFWVLTVAPKPQPLYSTGRVGTRYFPVTMDCCGGEKKMTMNRVRTRGVL